MPHYIFGRLQQPPTVYIEANALARSYQPHKSVSVTSQYFVGHSREKRMKKETTSYLNHPHCGLWDISVEEGAAMWEEAKMDGLT